LSSSYDEFDNSNEAALEKEEDPRVISAEERIVEVIRERRVVTDREIKVRLEKDFFPWVTGRAMGKLLEEEPPMLKKYGYAGRRRIARGITEGYYCLPATSYDEIRDIIQQKREVSAGIVAILTGEAPASTHAEDIFEEAFLKLGFIIHGRDVSEFRGRKIHGEPGKEPPNLDFVIERDNAIYGVDVKNWIRYEADTRVEVTRKVRFALELGVTPFIIARYVDQDTIYTGVLAKRGLTYRYIRLIVQPSFESLAVRARELLGYPVMAIDQLPSYSLEWLEKLHEDNLKRAASK
jgi:hypothetical protein